MPNENLNSTIPSVNVSVTATAPKLCYIGLTIGIHGLQADAEKAPELLKAYLRECLLHAMTGEAAPLFNFRNDVEGDIEIEVDETAP